MRLHPDEKGIIHCHSYKVANFIKQYVHDKRLLFHNAKNRERVLRKHMKIKKPSVLVSPSMQEGVDLKDNASRFQVICKLPFPYLGDMLVKKKMKKWDWWYSFQTVRVIIQSIGRSIRHQKDYAKTYILDSCWENFYRDNYKLFPETFVKSYSVYKKN